MKEKKVSPFGPYLLAVALAALMVLVGVSVGMAQETATEQTQATTIGKKRVAKVFVRWFYKQDAEDRYTICEAWDYDYVRTTKIFAKPLIKGGVRYTAAVKGVVLGLYTVCGVPDSYEGMEA